MEKLVNLTRSETAGRGEEPFRSSLVVLPCRPDLSTGDLERIASALGLSYYDVRQRCLSGKPAVLVRSDDVPALAAGEAALHELGHGAAVINDERVRAERYPLSIRSVSIARDGIEFLDVEERVAARLSTSDDMLLMIANPGRMGDSPVGPGGSKHLAASALYAENDRRLSRLLLPPFDGIVLDAVWDGGPRVRIRAGRFNFHSLGDRASPAVAINMKTLLALLMERSARPVLDVGASTIQPPHPGLLTPQLVDGKDYDRPDGESERTHEIYCRTLTSLWRAGLFAGVASGPRSAKRSYVMTRAVPPGESDPRPAAAPTGAAAAGSSAGAREPDPTAGIPVFIPPPDIPEAAGRPLDPLRRWGPPVLLVPILAATVAGILLRKNGGLPVAVLAAGSLALTHGLTLFARRRRIENVPTSRIRSVAAGLCEIAGTAEPATPLVTPFSLMPCVYFEYRIESRDAPGNGTTPDGPTTILSLSLGRETSPRDGFSRYGHSGHIPFRVADATGSVEVDPRGAIVDVSTTQTFYNPPFDGGLVPPGVPVIVHETFIPVGYPIYVMGEYRPAADAPAGGVSGADGPAGPGPDGRTDRMVVGRPAHADLFYISERSEKTIVKGLALRATVALGLGIVLVATGFLLVIQALGGWE